MSAEVIVTIHQLATACKKYKGILFTEKDGNIVDDTNDEKNADNNTLEITGMDTNTTQMETQAEIEIVGNSNTGVDNATAIVGNNNTGVDSDNIGTNNGLHTTGVRNEQYDEQQYN